MASDFAQLREDTPFRDDPVNPTLHCAQIETQPAMMVKEGLRTIIDAPANAAPDDDVVWRDYYSVLPHLRLSVDAAGGAPTMKAIEVLLDSADVIRVVECALRHSNTNMRQSVLSAVRHHPETFRQLFEFGLSAPAAFHEIREIVAHSLAKRSAAAKAPATGESEVLLPQMPLPAHLRDRARK
jgi:hypothetical protein